MILSSILRKDRMITFSKTVFSVFLALLFGSLFLIFLEASPLEVYGVMFERAATSFDLVLRRAMVLMMSGLAVAIPMKAGMFNMGGEGQIVAGALTAAVVGGLDLPIPAGFHTVFALASAAIIGMLLSGFSGVLSIKRNVNEVISTIMMNSIIAYIATYLVMNPFRGSEFSPQTAKIKDGASIPSFFGLDFSWALVFAIFLCISTYVFLERTPKGLELKAAGLNPVFSRYQGIKVGSMGLLGMLLGGAAAALGGAFEVLGGSHSYTDEYFLQYGFDGIAIAFMAGNNPLGIIVSSIFMAAVRVGSLAVSRRTGVSTYFVSILQGLIIVLLVVPYFSDSILAVIKKIFCRKKEVDHV